MNDLPARGPGSRRLLAVVIATTAMSILSFSLIYPALPDLADEMGVSRGAIGLVQGAVAVPGIVLAIAIGWFSDRFGRRATVQISLALFGSAGLAGFVVRDFWPLVGLRVVQGVGAAGLVTLGVVVIGDLFRGKERRWALGINGAGITATSMIAPVVGGLLARGGAFRPFLVYGLALPMIIPAAFLPGRKAGARPAAPIAHVRGMLTALRESGRLADFLGLLPMTVLVLGIGFGFGFTTTPLYLEAEFGLDAFERGLIQAILSVGAVVSSLASGRFAARMTGSHILDMSIAAVVVGFGVLAAAPGLVFVSAGVFLVGFGLGALFPVFQDMASSAAPAVYRGAAVGTWLSSNRLGQSAGPVAASLLAVGIGGRPSYALAGAVVAAVAVAWRPARRLANRPPRGDGQTPPAGNLGV